MSNRNKGRSSKEVRTSERRGQVMLWAAVGKIAIYIVIFLVILWLTYAVLGGPLSIITWIYNLDPNAILLMMALISVFFTFLFMNVVMSRGRSNK